MHVVKPENERCFEKNCGRGHPFGGVAFCVGFAVHGEHQVDQSRKFLDELLPLSVNFRDIAGVLSELHRVMKKGGKAAIILGNAYFPPPYEPVECDVILAELAEAKGFSVEKILVLNQRLALAKRVQKVGVLRESDVVLGKP